jgi:hypothetical protein
MENKNVDKGWEAMRAMLDREMPVKKRRRAGWWWLGLLLIPALLLADWWHHHSGASTTPLPHPSTETPLAQTLQPGTENHAEHSDQKSLEALKSLGTKDISTGKPIIQYTQKRNLSTPTQFLAADKPEKQASNPETGIPSPLQQPASIDITYIKPGVSILPKHNHIPMVSPGIITAQPHSATKYKPYWEIGATSMASTEQFNNINGFSTGVTADWAFSRKWGLRGGLLYNIHTPQENHRPVVTVNADDYTSDLEGDIVARNVATGAEVWNMPGMNTLADSLSGNVYIPVSRLQRIELPVLLYWQATRHIKVFGGCSLSKTLITRADRLNYSGEYQLTLNDQIAEEEVSNLSGHQMNTWNANAMFGLGMRLSPVFELGLNGTIPFQRHNNLGTTNNGTMTNQEIRIKTQRTPLFGMYGTLYF